MDETQKLTGATIIEHQIVESFHVKFIEWKDTDVSYLKQRVVVTSSSSNDTSPAISSVPDSSSTDAPLPAPSYWRSY